ncbi:hypothetical protein PHMEG_00024874 [Phytophthora megakarya]|uniref:Uncharacterized protein n=1 Tax=Phytophthora megakarya TaxID=4795 RepID=A0A225VE52_9STRA|nr:hypothetical protein PHMEG_00024874 [Phytophthora megakarya]
MSPNGLAKQLLQAFDYFSDGVARKFNENTNVLAPIPPSAASFLKLNQVVVHGMLTEVWLKHTEQYEPLCEHVMKQCVVKKLSESTTLRRFSNYSKDVRSQLNPDGECYLASDNASAVRNMAKTVFEDTVLVKQIHFIQLRTPKDVEVALRSLVNRISINDLNYSVNECNGCVESNIGQILRGDLHVD